MATVLKSWIVGVARKVVFAANVSAVPGRRSSKWRRRYSLGLIGALALSAHGGALANPTEARRVLSGRWAASRLALESSFGVGGGDSGSLVALSLRPGLRIGHGFALGARFAMLLSAPEVVDRGPPESAAISDVVLRVDYSPRWLADPWLGVRAGLSIKVVLPASAKSRAEGMHVGVAPGVFLDRAWASSKRRWFRALRAHLSFSALALIKDGPTYSIQLPEHTEAFIGFEAGVGPSVLRNYSSFFDARWHLAGAATAVLVVRSGLGLAVSAQLLHDIRGSWSTSGGFLGSSTTTPLPEGVQLTNSFPSSSTSLYLSTELRYTFKGIVRGALGVSHLTERAPTVEKKLRLPLSNEPTAKLRVAGPMGLAETRFNASLTFLFGR